MSNIKIILSLVFTTFSLGGVLYAYQDQLYPLLESSFGSSSITTPSNQGTTVSNFIPKKSGGGVEGFSSSGKALSAETDSLQGKNVSEDISNSPLLSLEWKQHQKSQITVRNGDFIIYDKEKLLIAKESVTSKKIADYTIQDEDIERNAITSRTIDDGTIIGDDVSQSADLTIRSLEITGNLTVGGTTSFGGDFDMQSNRILNIGNVGTDFTSTGGLDLAGNLNVSGTVNSIAGTLTLPALSSNGGVLYTNASGAVNQTLAGTSAQFLVANASNIPTFVSMSGDALITAGGVSTIQPDSVALGTDTTGNYVATITGSGTITSLGATTGEGIAHTLSVTADSIGDTELAFNTGQHLTTASTPTFTGLTLTGALGMGSNTITSGLINGQTITSTANFTGTVSAVTGYKVNGTAVSGNVLRGDGTNFVSATLGGSDITGATLSKIDDTNVTLTLGGSPSTALLRATSLTLGWTGQLSVARGGTGVNTFTQNGVLYGNTTNALQATTAGTSAQFLVANLTGVPIFVTMGSDASLSNAGALTISADAVALTTDTTGNYVATITGSGTITSLGATTGEGIAHTLSVTADSIGDTELAFNTGQHLTTASTPTFTGLTLTGALGMGSNTITSGLINGQTITSTANFTGTVTAVGVNSGAGLLQGSLGLTITGGTANINASSNFATNIGTGSSTGAITLGGNQNTFALDSTNFDVSTAGVLSGITGYTQGSGNFGITGTGTFGTGTGAISLNGATSVTGTNTFTVGTGLTSLGGNLTVTGTSWTATPTISGLVTATSGVTSNGTLTVGANQNATMVSGTGIFTQTYTGTGTANTITANALTTGNILSLSSSSTTAGANNTGLNISIGGANGSPAITRYGLQSSVTATNATSGTNIAGYFTATGATTANYGVYAVATSNYFSGSVGIGTTSPSSMLSLYGATNAMRFSYDATNYSTLSANSTGELQIKGASVYDASLTIGSNDANSTAIIFDNLVSDFYVGIDNEDSSKFKIGLLGQDAFMTILPTTGYVGIGTTSPSSMLSLYGVTNAMRLSYDATNYTTLSTTSTGDLQIKGASVYDASLTIGSNDANSTAIIFDNLTNDFYVGIDNEDSSKFKIGLNTQDAFMTILSTNGYIGIGTTAPSAMLQVGTATAGGNVKINNGYICVDTDGTCTGATTAGTVYAVNAYTTGADYAEYFYTRDTDLLPGEAVCIDSETENGVKRCQNNGDNNIMGIVSSNPSIVGNKNHPNDDHYKIIGMLGQVSGKVSNENGNIKVGDNLTAGLVPGEMRKANAGESTVGVALENSSDTTVTIQILISRRNQSLTVEKVEQAVTDNIAMMNIGDQVNTLVSNAKTALDTQIASQSDILTLQSQNIISLQNDIIALQNDNGVEKNKTALLQSQMDLITAQNQTVIDFISTLDMSTLIYKDVLGNLNIGTGTFTAKDIEATGTVKAKDIITDTLTMKENSTSGKGVILAGQTETTIDTPDVSENAKISLTAKGSSNGKILYFDEIVEGKSFKVKIDAPTVEKDINFVWLIIK